MSDKPASHPLLLLPCCHFEPIKALHPRARVHSKQYLQIMRRGLQLSVLKVNNRNKTQQGLQLAVGQKALPTMKIGSQYKTGDYQPNNTFNLTTLKISNPNKTKLELQILIGPKACPPMKIDSQYKTGDCQPSHKFSLYQ